MKQKLFTLILLSLCCLTACGKEREVSGEIVSRDIQDGVGTVSFVLRTDADEEIAFLMRDDTRLLLWPDDCTDDDFNFREDAGMLASVYYDGGARSQILQNERELPAYAATQVSIDAVRTPDVMTLSDGAVVELWRGSSATLYRLEKGPQLLWEQTQSGPDAIYMGAAEDLDDLNETARKRILDFYAEQGLLYNVQEELERAYASYLACGEEQAFRCGTLRQEISLSASNETILSFLTAAALPIGSGVSTELRLSAIFDRSTGERLELWDLFSCGEAEAKQALFDLAKVPDPALRSEMEAAFRPEYVTLFPTHLDLTFPLGSLPSQAYSYGLGLEYDDGLCEIMYPWAIPISSTP